MVWTGRRRHNARTGALALLTPERRFLRANAAMCRLLGRTEAGLRGMAVEDLTRLVAIDYASWIVTVARVCLKWVRREGRRSPRLIG